MKLLYTLVACVILTSTAQAQTQKDWYIIGSQISNLGFNFQKGNTQFSFNLSPRVAWFIKDNLAVGAEVDFGLNTAKGYTQVNYGIGPVARYYVSQKSLSVKPRARFFIDGNVGISGENIKTSGASSTSTNGLGFGIGPGIAYFITPNIALETLLKYNINVGFGNSTTNNALSLNLGFQIHLPRSKVKSLKSEMKK